MLDPVLTKERILNSPSLPETHPLQKLVSTLVKKTNGEALVAGSRADKPLWGPAHYGLDKIARFQSAPAEQQMKMLHTLGQLNLREAYHVEHSGITFNSKMMLLSNSLEEKLLYSNFAAQEAQHLVAVREYIDDSLALAYKQNPFLQFLAEVIQMGNQDMLVLLVQVILEGYGFSYYSRLAEGTTDANFQKVIQGILKDEAFHHGSGIVLAKTRQSYPAETIDVLVEMIHRIAMLSRHWPRNLLTILEQVTGEMTKAEKLELLKTLRYEEGCKERNQALEQLVRPNSPKDLNAAIDRVNLFKVLSAEEYVTLH